VALIIKSADGITELKILCGVSGKLYANSIKDSNDLLLNGDGDYWMMAMMVLYWYSRWQQ